jgi:hypothetical protein
VLGLVLKKTASRRGAAGGSVRSNLRNDDYCSSRLVLRTWGTVLQCVKSYVLLSLLHTVPLLVWRFKMRARRTSLLSRFLTPHQPAMLSYASCYLCTTSSRGYHCYHCIVDALASRGDAPAGSGPLAAGL